MQPRFHALSDILLFALLVLADAPGKIMENHGTSTKTILASQLELPLNLTKWHDALYNHHSCPECNMTWEELHSLVG